MFLLSASVYYFFYVAPTVFSMNLNPSIKTIFSAFEMSFSFIQTYLYVVFIIAYLNLAKDKRRVYKFFLFFKYYNLVFIFIFILLGFFDIRSTNFFGIIALIDFPILITALILMRGLYTTYSNIIVLGTTFNILGTITSLYAINYEIYYHTKLHFEVHAPAQAGLLLDLFILDLSVTSLLNNLTLIVYFAHLPIYYFPISWHPTLFH